MKNIYKFLFIFSLLLFSGQIVLASIDDVDYPIAELGNCESREGCRFYCDQEENHLACIEFAKGKEIYDQNKADRMAELEKFNQGIESAFKDTPGNCVAPRECDAYCRIEANLEECLNYGVKIGHTTQEEADKIREKANKGGPGGCMSKEVCRSYCDNPENSDECMQFLVEDGKLTQEQAQFAAEAMREAQQLREKEPAEINKDKAEEILKTTAGPGGCTTTEECSKYCQGGEHMEECLNFAQENGLIDSEDIEKVKKLMKAGGPGGCKGQAECRAYCDKEENGDECMNFSLQNGTMTQDQYEKMKKLREIMEGTNRQEPKGPGGCQTEEECNKYCSDLSYIEECIDYAREGGRLDSSIIKRMMGKSEDARKKFEEMEKERSKFTEEDDGFEPYSGAENPGGQIMPPQAGPGGCKGPKECQKYCENNPDVCRKFQSSDDGVERGKREESNNNEYQESRKKQRPPEDQRPCQGEECNYNGPQVPPGDFQQGGDSGPTSFWMNPNSLAASAITTFINFLIGR